MHQKIAEANEKAAVYSGCCGVEAKKVPPSYPSRGVEAKKVPRRYPSCGVAANDRDRP